MNDQFSKDAPILANVGVQNIWPTPCISAAGSQDLLWEWSSSACHARPRVWAQSEAGHSPSLARAWCWPVWPFGICSPPISSPCAQLAHVPSPWPLLRMVLAATLYLRSSCSVWLHLLPGINKWYYSEEVFLRFPFLALVCILEHILLLFTICTPAYLSVTVLLKHSLYTSCKLWIQQLGLRLLFPFMGQGQFEIASHKQTCLLTIVNSAIDRKYFF